MTKTPKELKESLEICAFGTANGCQSCSYFSESKGFVCITRLARDALFYIQKLEKLQPKHASWECTMSRDVWNTYYIFRCSACGDKVQENYAGRRCGNCGAIMDGRIDDGIR